MNKRLKSRKRGLPDWLRDDLPDPGNELLPDQADELPLQTAESIEHSKNELLPKQKPSYTYLPGNKHSQNISNLSDNTVQYGGRNLMLSDEAVSLSMPFITYTGSCIYSTNYGDCSLLCEDIINTYVNPLDGHDLHVGFDLEWPVNFGGSGSDKVALVQFCINESKCYLFHISAMRSFPKSLKLLLEHDKIKKIGVNIEGDMWKLTRDFDFNGRHVIKTSIIDLGKYANKVLKSSENWSLEGLCRNVLRMRMDKDEKIRCGQWDSYPLSDKQKEYALTDAYAALEIYKTLKDR